MNKPLKLGQPVWVQIGRGGGYSGRRGDVVCNLPHLKAVSVNFDGLQTDNDVCFPLAWIVTNKRELKK